MKLKADMKLRADKYDEIEKFLHLNKTFRLIAFPSIPTAATMQIMEPR